MAVVGKELEEAGGVLHQGPALPQRLPLSPPRVCSLRLWWRARGQTMTVCFFRKTDTLVKYEEKVMGNICHPLFFN